MTNKTVTLFGFGKIVIGLLHPVISGQLKAGVTFICCVRENGPWTYRRNRHSTIKTHVMSYEGIEMTCTEWKFNEPEETFTEFVERCKKSQSPGIWLYQDNQMLLDAIVNSTVVGTSVGIDALDNLLSMVDGLSVADTTFYAFENQPTAVRHIAKRHSGVNVVHCPIDRVVVSRVFDEMDGSVAVTLGKDPSESIMIYDKNGVWKELLCVGNDSSLTVTGDSSLLDHTLKRKLYGKNLIHKLACQIALCGKSPDHIRDMALCEVITPKEIKYMQTLKPAILFPAVLSIFPDGTIDHMRDFYNDMSLYYDLSLNTVVTDKKDTIGRIIHLDSVANAQDDRRRLLLTLDELRSTLTIGASKSSISFLAKEIGITSISALIKALDEAKEIVFKIEEGNP